MTHVDDLRQLSGQLVAPPEGMAIPAEVWEEVARWPEDEEERGGQLHAVCGDPDCRQSIMVLTRADQSYSYSGYDQAGLTLAHLIQRHGWTREGGPR